MPVTLVLTVLLVLPPAVAPLLVMVLLVVPPLLAGMVLILAAAVRAAGCAQSLPRRSR
jgi:hypothetical protein